jgi:hypothetical protein
MRRSVEPMVLDARRNGPASYHVFRGIRHRPAVATARPAGAGGGGPVELMKNAARAFLAVY